MRRFYILIGVLVILLGLVAYALWARETPPEDSAGTGEEEEAMTFTNPTDFASFGAVAFNHPETEEGTPVLEYETSGEETYATLAFDRFSACTTPQGSTPCSEVEDIESVYGGQRVLVEGETQEGDTVLVRKMRIWFEGQPEFSAEPGDVFATWPQALSLIEECDIEMVAQTHALDVYLTLPNGTRIRAVEPSIDEVFQAVQGARCDVPVATE